MTPQWRVDPTIQRLQAWRSWLGYGSVVIAIGLQDALTGNLLDTLLIGAVVGFLLKGAVAIPVVALGVVFIAVRSHRSQRRGRFRPALRPFALLTAFVGVPVAAFMVLEGSPARTSATTDRAGGTAAALLSLAVFALTFLWPFAVVAAVAVVVHGVRHLFCSGDVHPLLPSILAFCVALVSGSENVWQALQPALGVERTLSLLGVGGSLTVVGLTVYEQVRLRRIGWHWGDLRLPADQLPAGHPQRRAIMID